MTTPINTVDELEKNLGLIINKNMLIFVQVGYNRFEIVSYNIKDDYCVLNVDLNANNPKSVELPPTDKEVA